MPQEQSPANTIDGDASASRENKPLTTFDASAATNTVSEQQRMPSGRRRPNMMSLTNNMLLLPRFESRNRGSGSGRRTVTAPNNNGGSTSSSRNMFPYYNSSDQNESAACPTTTPPPSILMAPVGTALSMRSGNSDSLNTRRKPDAPIFGSTSRRHQTFSFENPSPPESPPPEVIVIPNKGGLPIASSSPLPLHIEEETTSSSVLAGAAALRYQVRSTSSSYPSEAGGGGGGVCSPSLTASPPMTFGRRILSSLGAYGFEEAHMSFLGSEETLPVALHPAADGSSSSGAAVEQLGESEAAVWGGSGGDQTSTIRNPGPKSAVAADTRQDENLPPPFNSSVDAPLFFYPYADGITNAAEINLSTQCLPRYSTNPDNRPWADSSSDSESNYDESDDRDHRNRHHRHHHRGKNTLKHRISAQLLLLVRRPAVKVVKKWIVRQFRASRKGSRALVRKVVVRDSGSSSRDGNKKKKRVHRMTMRVPLRAKGEQYTGRVKKRGVTKSVRALGGRAAVSLSSLMYGLSLALGEKHKGKENDREREDKRGEDGPAAATATTMGMGIGS
ncbi:hypothetical protein B0H63DRAFT_446658 [Podospora didyma]|uniref:Uncharacterized protein n=1 Tax=Podospora didyma TaxID=330526 RepID=A0AAE0U4V7_9PEZI|nr:hypothetical protein B0H63DRAFT_446658 [Podospora didyma]